MKYETSASFRIPEAYYTTLFDALSGSNVLLQADSAGFNILAASPAYIQQTGFSREAIIGKGFFEAFPDSSDPNNMGVSNLRASLEYVLLNKEPHEIPVQRYDTAGADGQFIERYWKAINKPVLSPDGEVAYIIHSAEEITDQVKAENREVQIEGIEKVFSLFMHAPLVVGLANGDDYVLEMVNDEGYAFWGKGPEILGKPILQGLPELEGQGIIELFDQVRNSGQPYTANEVPVSSFVNGRHEQHYFNLVYQPYFSKDSAEATGVFTISFDVTEQVKARQKALESEEKYRNLFESMDQGYCTLEIIFDGDRCVDYRYLETNPSFERHLGMTNALGKTIREIAPDIEPKWFEFYGGVALTGKAIRIEEESKAFNKWFEVYAIRLGSADERKVGVFFTDVTARKKAEEAIRQSENNLRNTILQAPLAMAILRGPSFIIDIANDSMYELWGRSKEELLNKSIFEGLPEVRHQGYEELLTGVFTTGERFSAQGIPVTLPRSGGIETVYMNLVYEAFREANGTISGVIAVAIDVTEQVVARMKIEESNKDFQFVTDFMPQMIWVTRPDGFHYYYNKQWYDYTGLTYGETQGEGWNAVFHPDDQERAWKLWRHSLATGAPYEIEYRCRRYDGAYRWVLGRALPLKDDAGNILKWFGTCTDIHDQKMEAQLLEQKVEDRTQALQVANEELKRSNANLEEFAFAASHDLKEPVRKIHFFTNHLRGQLSARLTESEILSFSRIENAAQRMGHLIDDLLLYSHVSHRPHATEAVDLNEKVQRVLEDLEVDIQEKKALIHVSKLPVVKGYRRQLQQLFQNLLSNALKYSKSDEPPQIYITASVVTENGQAYNAITVRDNGIGFEQQYAEKIFQMFSRLHGKGAYSGTGVGLSIVKRVVQNHSGFIRVESIVNEGSVFKVYLPA
jgi:PAS domain S-box-containing protein